MTTQAVYILIRSWVTSLCPYCFIPCFISGCVQNKHSNTSTEHQDLYYSWESRASSLVTSHPTHKGKGCLVNIEQFLGPILRAAASMGRLVTRLYHLLNYNTHVRETGCTWLWLAMLQSDWWSVFTAQKVLGPRNHLMFTRHPFPLWVGWLVTRLQGQLMDCRVG